MTIMKLENYTFVMSYLSYITAPVTAHKARRISNCYNTGVGLQVCQPYRTIQREP
jgi:hypothetical protein